MMVMRGMPGVSSPTGRLSSKCCADRMLGRIIDSEWFMYSLIICNNKYEKVWFYIVDVVACGWLSIKAGIWNGKVLGFVC